MKTVIKLVVTGFHYGNQIDGHYLPMRKYKLQPFEI